MACPLHTGFSVFGPCFNSTAKESAHHCYSNGNLQLKDSTSRDFLGKPFDHKQAQVEICVGSGQGWWEKTLKPNMVEINSAQQLVDSLLKAGDRLVRIDFYSPACGGCKTLHPKIRKFKDAIARYRNDGCSFGPAKGLDESELLALASIGLI